jgi:hypothetical protein
MYMSRNSRLEQCMPMHVEAFANAKPAALPEAPIMVFVTMVRPPASSTMTLTGLQHLVDASRSATLVISSAASRVRMGVPGTIHSVVVGGASAADGAAAVAHTSSTFASHACFAASSAVARTGAGTRQTAARGSAAAGK